MMDFESRLASLLMELGLMASSYGWRDDAEHILAGLLAMRPHAEEPFVALALMHMMDAKYDEAVAVLREKAIPLHPQSDILHAFLALALRLDGKVSESDQIAEHVISKGKNANAIRLSETMLREIR